MRTMLLLPLVVAALATPAAAQTTGAFDTPLPFGGTDRTLSFSVPPDYDSTKPYSLMVCLHGLGDNSKNYRNALHYSLNWSALHPNTILVCPDGGDDRSRDFYAPEGDEAIIESTIRYVQEHYNVDTTAIVLQGFSLGGRSALKYGLDHPQRFRGLLLSTPAMQGILDVLNDPNGSLGFAYGNGPAIPVFVTVGAEDLTYVDAVDRMVRMLKFAGTPVRHTVVAGLGHSIPGNDVNGLAWPFFAAPAKNGIDVDIFHADLPRHTCGTTIPTRVYVQNAGDVPLTSLTVVVDADGQRTTKPWTGTLPPAATATIDVDADVQAGDLRNVTITVESVNGGGSDTDTTNDRWSGSLFVAGDGGHTTNVETFDGNTVTWDREETGSLFSWYRDTDVRRSGTASIAAFNTILIFYTGGARESIVSPYLDIAGMQHRTLTFDYAYNYHRYTPPVVTSELIFTDTLEIGVSTDCGATYTTIFRKAGADLATAPEPILNPLTVQSVFFYPSESQWRTEVLDLSAFAQANNALIRFSYISGMGGSINIDDIKVGVGTTSVAIAGEPTAMSVYPNPARERVTVDLGDAIDGTLRLVDHIGRVLIELPITAASQGTVDVEAVPSGHYTLEVRSGGTVRRQSLVVRH